MFASWSPLAAVVASLALAACEQLPTRVVAHPPVPPGAARDAGSFDGITDLGTLGGREMMPFAINDAGVAIGVANDAQGQFHGWMSTDGAPMQVGPAYVANVAWGAPEAINASGAISGWQATPDGGELAFVATPDGRITRLSTPVPNDGSPVTSEAVAINASGDAAGWYAYDGVGDARAVLWKGGSRIELGSIPLPDGVPDVTCRATALDDADQVVGYCADATGMDEHPFFWSAATGMFQLPVTGEARGIDNSGVVTGYATYDDQGDSRAFVWQPNGQLQTLPLPFGVVSVVPLTLNDERMIGGQCSTDGQQYVACAGGTSGADWFVSDMFVESSAIVALNDHGVALGFIQMPDAPFRAVEWSLAGSSKPADATPPVITPTLAGTLGASGWYTSDVALTWSESDPESNVASTAGCDPVAVSTDTKGASFTCSATNGAGLTAQRTVTIQRDATPPSIVYDGDAGTYTVDQIVAITCTATDATSGIARTTCGKIGGDAYDFALGANTFSAVAVDVAGNVAHASTSFVVQVTVGSLGNLTRRWVSNPGVANSLVAKLDAAAQGGPQSKLGKLGAYVNELRAQTGKTIAADKAAILERLVGAV